MAPKSRTLEEMDAGWNHGKCVEPNNRRKVQCNYCGKKMDGGITRLKQHLAGIKGNVASCPEVPVEIKREMLLLVEGKQKDKKIADRRKQLVEEELTRTSRQGDSSDEEDDADEFADLRRDMRESRREHAAGEWSRRWSVGEREAGSSRGPTLGGRSKSVAYHDEVRNIPEIGGRSMDPYVLRKQGTKQPKIKGALKGIKNAKEQIGRFISKFFIYNNIPFNAAKSPHYQPMIDTIAACGSGVKGPTPYEISNTYLEMEITDMEEYLKSFHRYWDEYGCTIMCDGWSTQNRKCIINFLVYSAQGTIFLKSVDASDKYKDANYIFGLMNEVVETIGENRVVQVVTDNGPNYRAAGKKLMEVRRNLYWTPCAAHCIDLMLKDIANDPSIKPLIQKSQDLTCFIYNHGWALSIMRTETRNGELVRPAITRFATNFLALDSILKHQADLKRMTNTMGWTENYIKLNRKDREKANVVVSLIDSQTYWRDIAGITAIFGPLVKVLRMVDSDDKAEMGHLYEAMDRAKFMIKKNVGKGYKKWWTMIDKRWNHQLHQDIHAAGYFLNPKYQYSNNVVNDDEVLNGFHRVVNRMVNDNETRLNINREAERFRLRSGAFSSNQFQSAVNRCLPVLIVFYGLQHFLSILGSLILLPLVIIPAMGGTEEDTSMVVSTVLFVSGVTTLFHTYFGTRLPLVQGPSFVYLAPALAIINSPEFQGLNANNFKHIMKELQGALIISSAFQAILGYSGLMSLLLRLINPVVVSPTIAAIGLSFFSYGFTQVGNCLEIGILQILLVIVFSLYLRKIRIFGHRIFLIYAVPLGLGVTWAIAFLLTESGAYSYKGCDINIPTSNTVSAYCRKHVSRMKHCRVDTSHALRASPWFRFPYPLQWGTPVFSWKMALVMCVVSIIASVDSVGSYHASSLLVASRPPTSGVVSRGIGMEGVCSVLAGLWGTGVGSTTLTENVHTIAVTKMGSRRAVELCAVILVLLSFVGKVGGFVTSIPVVMVSALLCFMWAMLAAMGLSNLRYSETGSSRNNIIVGLSLFFSLSIPAYFQQYRLIPNANSPMPSYFQPYIVALHGPFHTGYGGVNYVLNTLLSFNMVVAFLIAVILDNTVPGSRQERGVYVWSEPEAARSEPAVLRDYELPFKSGKLFRWVKWVGV